MLDIRASLDDEQRAEFDSMPEERRRLMVELLEMLDELGLVEHEKPGDNAQ